MLRSLAAAATAVVLTVALGSSASAGTAPRPRTLAVSQTPLREEAGADHKVVMSADARYVVFVSSAANLLGAQAGHPGQVYRRDMQTGTTALVSVGWHHQPADSAASPEQLAVSGSGRYVAYVSRANNVVPGVHDRLRLLIRDMDTQSTVVPYGGDATTGEEAFGPALAFSADDRYLAFAATGLWDDDRTHVYRFDRDEGTASRVDQPAGRWRQGGDSGLRSVAMSADGRMVAFDSSSSNLLTEAVVTGVHTYVRDMSRLTTQLVDRTPTGGVSEGTQGRVAISGDGQFVAFESGPEVGTGTDWLTDLYRRDLRAGRTERVAVSGYLKPRVGCCAAMSYDGRYVAYIGEPFLRDTPAWPGDLYYENQAFLRDMAGQTQLRISALPDGLPVAGGHYVSYPCACNASVPERSGFGVADVALSADGRFAAFTTADPDVLPGRPVSSSRLETSAAYRAGPLH